jgi:photosystem II stability/assembly factor-like uncharacterized protein
MIGRSRGTGVIVALAAVAVLSAGVARSAAPPSRVALVPNAIAFRDPSRGVLGTGWTSCASGGFGCRPQGTISLTTDGGRTWKVVLRTREPVVWVGTSGRVEQARLYDGENLSSTDGGRRWRPSAPPPTPSPPCPLAVAMFTHVVVTTPGGEEWALCAGQGGAGSMGKAVYRLGPGGWKRVAYTPFPGSGGGYGGIARAGYPLGMAMTDDGFGLIWEDRGTLYVTRDGGLQWVGLPRVARPEIDFGESAAALPHGVGFALLGLGGGERRRLVVTRDGGKTWRVAHRWR